MALLNIGDEIRNRGLNVTGVVHVGAHLGEEGPIYADLGIDSVIWIEANPEVIPKLQQAVQSYPGQVVLNELVLDEAGRKEVLNVTNYDGMSSSVIPWGTHPTFSPDTVIVRRVPLVSTTLDRLMEVYYPDLPWRTCNLLNIDIEGAGLWALQGAPKLLDSVEHLYLEIQTENVYDGAPKLDEVDGWLAERGFERVALGMVEGQGWGDAMWARR